METKEFIGHGTKHKEWNIIDVVLEADKATEHFFEYEGKRYLKFSVAERKEPSKFGATHTVYVRAKAEASVVAEPTPKPKRQRKQQA